MPLQITQGEKTIQEQNTDYQVALQEVRNHQRAVEQLKADLTLSRSSHAEGTSRFNQDIQLLRDDLELTKNDLEEARSLSIQLRSQNEDLREELEKETKAHADAVMEVSSYSWGAI